MRVRFNQAEVFVYYNGFDHLGGIVVQQSCSSASDNHSVTSLANRLNVE